MITGQPAAGDEADHWSPRTKGSSSTTFGGNHQQDEEKNERMPAFCDVIQAVETHRHTHAPQTTPPAVVAAASEGQKARKRGHHARRHDSLSSAGGLKGRRSLFADDTKLRSLTLAQHALPPRLWISEYSREGAARRGGRKNIDREQPSDVTPMTTSRKLDAATPRRCGCCCRARSPGSGGAAGTHNRAASGAAGRG